MLALCSGVPESWGGFSPIAASAATVAAISSSFSSESCFLLSMVMGPGFLGMGPSKVRSVPSI